MKHPLFSSWWGKHDLGTAKPADDFGIEAALAERKAALPARRTAALRGREKQA